MRIMGGLITVALLAVMGLTTSSWAQGSLTPPAAPAPTMKTLDEIWNQIGQLQAQVAAVSNRVTALSAAQFTSIAPPLTVFADTNSPVGQYCSLAFAPSGRPAISYYDGIGYHLSYAAWNGASWAIQSVDTNASVGAYTSLKFHPPTGRPAISYYDGSNGDLKYAGWNGIGWDIYTVDSSGDVGTWTSLAFHPPTGYPAISYYDSTSNDLKYAAWNGASWVTYTVDIEKDAGKYTSLAFAPSGNPAISYMLYDASGLGSTRLKYAVWNGATWDIQTVDSVSMSSVGDGASLAFTPSGYPAISYYSGWPISLKYAVWNGAAWDIQTVYVGVHMGKYTSLKFTPSGNPAISYYDDTDDDLEYAVWNGTSWDIRTVDSAGDVGKYTSLAFTPSGNAGISYYDASNQRLKYAEVIQAP